MDPLTQVTQAQPHAASVARQAHTPARTFTRKDEAGHQPSDTLGASVEPPEPGILTRLRLKHAVHAAPAEQEEESEGIPLETLRPIAQEAMKSRGLSTEFSVEALEELRQIPGPARLEGPGVEDLRHLQWASIDNESTRDIDQLAYATDLGDGRTRLLVAIADVAELVPKDQALDLECRKNTVTVYNPGNVKAMLPEQLSTDWTSLGPDVDRRAIVTELIVGADGEVESSRTFEAAVRNHCKTDYKAVSGWLEGSREMPESIAARAGLDEQLKLQMEVGRRLGEAAERRGALEFHSDRVLTVEENGRIVDLEAEKKNQASEAVAHMMIATNTATARFLRESGFPVFQRVVEAPGRWERMREVALQAAAELPPGKEMPSELAILPEQPDPKALGRFLSEIKARHPEKSNEVSFSMLKLMGGGDYVATPAGAPLKGHFGQGVPGGEVGYVHSTAPNRRFPDIVVQRMVKAALRGEPCPYSQDELNELADRCNEMESAAKGASRQVQKAAVAHYLTTQVGEEYPALVTGSTRKGVFVKVLDPPIEGKLVEGLEGADVGDRLRVTLKAVDTEKGYIDFARVQEEVPTSSGVPTLLAG